MTAAINSNTPVAVKNVEGTYYKDAELNLQQEGFQTQTVQSSSSTVPQTLVISQSPAPGTRVAKQTVVTLTVSTGKPKTTVPTLVNLPLGQAQTDLANANLRVQTQNINSAKVPFGSVTSSSPAAGTPVLVGSLVTLYVSQGPKQIGVPSVVGEPYANAAGTLQGANFKVTRTEAPNAAPVGQVVSQTPAGGTSARRQLDRDLDGVEGAAARPRPERHPGRPGHGDPAAPAGRIHRLGHPAGRHRPDPGRARARPGSDGRQAAAGRDGDDHRRAPRHGAAGDDGDHHPDDTGGLDRRLDDDHDDDEGLDGVSTTTTGTTTTGTTATGTTASGTTRRDRRRRGGTTTAGTPPASTPPTGASTATGSVTP